MKRLIFRNILWYFEALAVLHPYQWHWVSLQAAHDTALKRAKREQDELLKKQAEDTAARLALCRDTCQVAVEVRKHIPVVDL